MKQGFSRRAKFVTLVSFLLLLVPLLLSACGDSPTATSAPKATVAATTAAATTAAATTAAPTTAAPTTAAPTTAAPTTAAPTTVAATTVAAKTSAAATTAATSGSAKTPSKGKITAPSGTPEAKATVPASGVVGSADPALAVLGKISTASLSAKSATLGIYSARTDASGTVTDEFTSGAVISGNDLAMLIQYKGVDAHLIVAGGKAYVTKSNVWQEATADDVKPFSDFLTSLAVIFPNEQELAKFAGSTVASYPKEKLEDGTPVGYLVLDTTGAADATVKTLGTVVYAYDPATSQIALFANTTATDYSVVLLSDYNNPNSKITAPQIGSNIAAAATPAATTAATSSSNPLGNVEVIEFPADVQKAFTASFPQSKDGQVVFYVSPDDAPTFANNLDAAFAKDGYKFAIPGNTKMAEFGAGQYIGLYSKASQPDIFVAVVDAAKLPDTLKTGFSEAQVKIISDAVKGKKSFAAIYAGTGLVQAFSNPGGGTAPTTAPTTP